MSVIKQYPQQYQGLLRIQRNNDKIQVFMVGSKEIMHNWTLIDGEWQIQEERKIPADFIKNYKNMLAELDKKLK